MREYNLDRIDLRSDTVTQPTKAMKEAMMTSVVGDDVLQDDPTVRELEEKIANMCGMEAPYLFLQVQCLTLLQYERIHLPRRNCAERTSHIYQYEGGGYAALSGVSVALIDGEKGTIDSQAVAKAIRKAAGSLGHYPDGTMVCVENTANRGGGTCYSQETLDAIVATAHEHDCVIHMDGAKFSMHQSRQILQLIGC